MLKIIMELMDGEESMQELCDCPRNISEVPVWR